MADFHALLRQLAEVYERDVGTLRREQLGSEDSEVLDTKEHNGGSSLAISVPSAGSNKLRGGGKISQRMNISVDANGQDSEGRRSEGPSRGRSNSVCKVVSELQNMDRATLGLPTSKDLAATNLGSAGGGRKNKVGSLQIREVERTWTELWVLGPLESVIGFIITFNVMLTMAQLQARGSYISDSLEEQQPFTKAPSDDFFLVCEHVFNAFFLMELMTRVSVLRRTFFRFDSSIQWFNIFDATIVIFCSLDLYLTPLFSEGQSPINLTFTRILRLARLARTLKVIQVLKAFSKLRILLKTVASSVLSFTWSMLILGVLNLGGAIFICQMMQPVIIDETVDRDLRLWLNRYYGTSWRAIWTMFEFTFSGGWPTYARRVVEEVHVAFALFYALYVSIVVFAVIRIITALFLKDTLNIAAKDADFMVQESMKAKKEYAAKLKELFDAADTSGDGNISFDEFRSICAIPEVVHYFHILDLEVSEVHALFNLLDNGDGTITYEEFVRGVVRLKGTARSMDVLTVVKEVQNINTRCFNLEHMISDLESKRRSSCDGDKTASARPDAEDLSQDDDTHRI